MPAHKITFSIIGFLDSFLTYQQYSAKSNIQLLFSRIIPFSIPGKERKFSSSKLPDLQWGPHSPIFNAYLVLLLTGH